MTKETVLITGAGRGIGLATAKNLAEQGYDLILNYRKEQSKSAANLYQLADDQQINSKSKITLVKADISVPREVTAMMKALQQQGVDKIHHLVLNAASAPFKSFAEMTYHDWKLLFNTNIVGNTQCVNEITPFMPKGSSICVLSSIGSRIVMPKYPLGMIKAALESLVGYLNTELAVKDIRVNGICAGIVGTDMLPYLNEFWTEIFDHFNKKPWRWVVKPEEVANIAAFLISKQSNAIRGTTILADLGMTLGL